jgi:FAD/FMN-containing dehydrogenase
MKGGAETVPMSRRTFLHAAGLGAAAAALGCASGGRPEPETSWTPPGEGGPRPAGPDWMKLRSRLAGSLVLPGDAGYAAACLSFNPLFDGRRPAAVARCARAEDVQVCVATAAASRLPIAARSGGHSYAGYSTPEQGLVVDLGGMAGVEVRPDGTAVVGAGARLIDVYAALARAGRCLPAGSCPTVGIAGLTLGGGLGVLARKLGLTCDRLVAARVVTADAEVRSASASSEPDLFWALRGGGGGNLGIVTSFTFATEPAPELTVFSLRFPAGSAGDVLGGWQGWIPAAPDELWSNCIVSSGSPPACRVGGCFVGAAADLQPLLTQLERLAGARPNRRFVQGLGYLDAMRYFAGCSRRSVSQCHLESDRGGQLLRESFVASSRVMAGPAADPAAVAALLDRAAGIDALFDGLGGAVARVPIDATAFPHRSALATVQVYCGVLGAAHAGDASQVAQPAATQAPVAQAPAAQAPATRAPAARQGRASPAAVAAKAVAEVTDALERLVGAGAYVNYIDPALPDWARACYGPNLDRLRQVARRYDPRSVFAFPQGLVRA